MHDLLKKVLLDWTTLGVLYGASPAHKTPDIEVLLLRTVELLPTFARLLPTTVTWLVQYERLVCRHRLSRMSGEVADTNTSAALGLLLDFVRQHTQSDHLNIVIASCRASEHPEPLFAVDQQSDALVRLAEDHTSDISRRWGLWTAEPVLKSDAIRPTNWLMKRNPALRYRAIFGGNLRASVLACLLADPDAGRSESALALACGVTRKAIREALEHLEFCGMVSRKSIGIRTRTVLEPGGVAA